MAEFYEYQAFQHNLKEFATRIGYICSLESNSQLKADEAYQEIKKLWQALKRSREGLHIADADEQDSRATD